MSARLCVSDSGSSGGWSPVEWAKRPYQRVPRESLTLSEHDFRLIRGREGQSKSDGGFKYNMNCLWLYSETCHIKKIFIYNFSIEATLQFKMYLRLTVRFDGMGET